MPVLGVVHSTKIGPNPPTITGVTDVGLNREFDNGAVNVAFSLPAENTAVSYRVTSSNGQVATGSSSPIRVQNLPTGINTTFTITGINDITIEGPPSAVSSGVVVTTVPFKPTMGVATAGNGQAFVVFSLLNSGGKTVLSYVATGSPDGSGNSTGSPITVSNLNNGVPHAFTVVAVNANGSSLPSSPSNVVTPSTGGGGVPAGTFYCYSSDCFSQDGVNYAYLQAPIFTSVSPTDQTTLTNYSGSFGSSRGTRVTYCNTVEATAAIGAQQSSCQATYVEPDPPPPCEPTEYTSECGTYTTGPQVPGCSPTNADYGYTVTQTASKTRTIYDCNGIIISTTLIPCTISTFTSVTSNDPRCPGYRAQTQTNQVSGGTSTNTVVTGNTNVAVGGTTTNQGTTSNNNQTSGTTFNSAVGPLTRDPAGAGYSDPVEGDFVWYSTVDSQGNTNLFLLPESNGVPNVDYLSANSDPAVVIPPIDLTLDFSNTDWSNLNLGQNIDYDALNNIDYSQPSTPAADDGKILGENNTTSGQGDTTVTSPPPNETINIKGFSINIFTLVRTIKGLIPAWYLKVGDKLLSADIEGFPYNNLLATDMDLIEWDAQNPQINLVETEIVSLRTRMAKWAIMVDSDMFSDSHYILIKRNDVTKFVKAMDLELTDLIWSNSAQDWVNIGLLRKIEVNHEVLSIDCEPYDIFFTERMLTHDSSTVD
jgi:hypothetical protein